jgi:myo-inositol-1(or 4)-monophosphatase
MIETDGLEEVGLRREIVVAAATARSGLSLARTMAGGGATIKHGRDVVTHADVAVEELITNALSDVFPYPVIGEERGGDRPKDGTQHWLVDPICGTRNYASGIPLYCVNIALVAGNEVIGAAVADASTDAIVVAEQGRGTWSLTGDVHPLTATDAPRTIVIEDGKSIGEGRERAAALVAAVIRSDRWDFRSLGTTLAFVYLAAGQISAYVLPSGTAEVHRAAGTLLVREAGGVLSDLDGNPWNLGSSSLVAAATGHLRDELVALATPPT